MPYSYVQYVGNGSTTTYAVTFPYLDKTHVEVYVGETLKAVGVDYNWSTPNAITFTSAPAPSAVIKLNRKSHPESRLVDFQDGSTLTQEILDLDSNQTFFMAQESIDRSDVVIAKAQEAIDAKNLAKQYAEWAYKYERLAFNHMEDASDFKDQAQIFKELAESASEQTKTAAIETENNRAEVATNTAAVATLKNDVLIAKGLIDSQANLAYTILTEAQAVANVAQGISNTTLATAQAAQSLADQLDETTAAITAQQTLTLATKTAAEAARDAAITAKDSAETAANTATTKASVATTQASTATTQAGIATTQAGVATTQATQAANSATAASASSVTAGASSTSAATSATNAANSATQAASSASSAAAIVTGVASNRPSIRPSLLLDFANTKQLDPRVTFSRPTTATYYDGKTVVKAEENLFTYSQPLNIGWAKVGTATLTDNSSTAPDATATAGLLASPATGDYIWQAPTTVIGQTYVFSVFVKNSTATTSSIYVRSSSTAALIFINWSGATLSSLTQTTGTATFSSVGNDWYRVVVTYTAVEASARHRIYAGDLTSTTGNILVWGAQLEQRSTVTAYTPTTTAPITNYIPALQTAVSNDARFDHDPVTGESKGLLIEEQRTNLVTYSDQFDNAVWGKINASITANAIFAPDGTLTGDKLIDSTVNGSHALSHSFVPTSSTAYAFSVFAKAGELSKFALAGAGFTGQGFSALFDLLSGTLFINNGGKGSITPAGNGWYRCTISFTASSTVGFQIQLSDSSGNTFYTGDGYSGLYLWGAQLEAGSFPTSYIPTVASQVTRSADSASMTGSNFSSWYRADEGTVYSEHFSLSSLTATQSVAANKYPALWFVKGGTGATSVTWYGSSVEFLINGTYNNQGSVTPLVYHKYAVSVAAFGGQSASSLNGASAVNRNGTTFGRDHTTFCIGGDIGNQSVTTLNGTIKRIAYYPKRLSNTELQGLTS